MRVEQAAFWVTGTGPGVGHEPVVRSYIIPDEDETFEYVQSATLYDPDSGEVIKTADPGKGVLVVTRKRRDG